MNVLRGWLCRPRIFEAGMGPASNGPPTFPPGRSPIPLFGRPFFLGSRLFGSRGAGFFLLLRFDDPSVIQAHRMPIRAVSRPAFPFPLELPKESLATRWKA